MKAQAVGAKDLPWLSPSAATLRTLARSPLSSSWSKLRTDPGLVILLARCSGRRTRLSRTNALDVRLLRACVQHLQTAPGAGWVDWQRPGCERVYEHALRQADLAARLAELLPHGDPQRAWVGGMLAALGCLAACAVQPNRVAGRLDEATGDCPRLDTAGLARRLSHAWRLPAWASAVAGRLALPVETAARLGADPVLFQVVQLAVLLHQRGHGGLRLTVGADLAELLAPLQLTLESVDAVADGAAAQPLPEAAWEAPAQQPLLGDLLELALRHRERDGLLRVERLHRDIDHLQEGLATRRAEVSRQVHALKLTALAELAAGAGHEINNPLAVISGQAQYLLRQLDRLDGPDEEIDNPIEYLANLRREIGPSLNKIINQTQRIHGILTELMQFARPGLPRPQPVEVGSLVGSVSQSLQTLADERRVRLVCAEPAAGLALHADPVQVQAALTALLRNAIEAAPGGGWAGIRVESEARRRLALLVEDSGAGPGAVAQQHLFDPFFSGRAAGRGRGLGLATAWRLARQQDGDLRFDGSHDGVTRFRLVLPLAVPSAAPLVAYGRHCA